MNKFSLFVFLLNNLPLKHVFFHHWRCARVCTWSYDYEERNSLFILL